ncbi:MAG: 3'(2'),5'-bisphosphate nucleotidase CysQ, partial [Candidatus Sericytochromatia bacterium]
MNHSMPDLLALACKAARAASEAILEIYGQDDFVVVDKANHSPLTAADLAAHNIIKEMLEPTGLPLLSEEGKHLPYEERRHWERFWLVDPLDGTKEFIKRNGEFTVNIALIEGQAPVLGVVHVPVTDVLYAALRGQGAFKEAAGVRSELHTALAQVTDPRLRVVASRSHRDADTEAFLASLDAPEVVSMGSSLKFMLLAEGT